jgi:DMSO/TMAO reductase YedYZ molybdopterin-dependent catalytic subunit
MKRDLRPGRRTFLGAAAAALVVADLDAGADERVERRDGLIVREREPENLEMPFETLDSFVTPTERFYVRNHFAAPVINMANWSLEVTGAVKKPLCLTYDELLAFPSTNATVTLECAGNGRLLLDTKVKGLQWARGAVGTAEWTGVPLAAVLGRASLLSGGVDVVFEGADRGLAANDPKPLGPIPYTRSLPLAKAIGPGVFLAHKMNGKQLPPRHGFPVRAIVSGWYGMACVKWLTRIVVTDVPFRGYYESIDYAVWDRRSGVPSLAPLTEMEVKSSIARPFPGETLRAGTDVRVHGAAWSGGADVTRVEVSTDAGVHWSTARLLGQSVPYAWRLWEFDWKAPRPGKHTLLARATDRRGRQQPMQRDPDRRSYAINHVVPTPVEVRA